MISPKKWANAPEDVPDEEHYAILYFGSIHIPGDERSRQAPGHGYPEHTETKIDYVVFPTREAWEAEIKLQMSGGLYKRDNWKAIKVTSARITTQVTLNISGA